MRYQSKSSMAYMFRNFWRLVYITLPAALVMAFAAFLYHPTAEIELISDLFKGNLTMTSYPMRLFDTLTVMRYGEYWWVFAIGVLLLICAECMTVVRIDRHMRVGSMPAFPLRRAAGIFPSMLLYIVCCIVATEGGALITVGLSILFKFIGNATAIVSVVLVLNFALRGLLAYLFCLLSLSFPFRYGENYRFNRAMSYSARTMFRKKKFLWCAAVLYPLVRLATLTVAYFVQNWKLDALVYAVVFLFVTTYIPCFSYKQYYDDAGGERRDIGKKIFG